MSYIRLIHSQEYSGPYSVKFYIHDMYSSSTDYYKTKYEGILLKEEAIQRAKSLYNSLSSYWNRIQSKNRYIVSVIVVDKNNYTIFEKS